MKQLSIVVPVYFNEGNLPTTVPALLELERGLGGMKLELIFVDDGSGDRSYEVLRTMQSRHPETITIIRLSRNFGSMNAILAGLSVARGDCVAMISADLQDPPELLLEMVRRWQGGAKSVLAVREGREEPLMQRFLSGTFYFLMRRFAIPDYPAGGFDFCLLDRQVVDEIKGMREKNTNLMSLIFWLGYQPVCLPYIRRERKIGRSRWTMAKKIKLFLDSFVGFSYFPIRMASIVGLGFSALGLAYAALVFYIRLVHGIPVPGFAALAVLVSVSAGVQMFMLGIIGEYLWRTLDEARNRPPFIIDHLLPARREGSGGHGEVTDTPVERSVR